jgi:phosphate:Na+ symporter
VLALAAFSSIVKLAGVVVFLPLIDRFSQQIVRLSGTGRESAIGRLDPAVAEAGGAIALEAAWRAILEVAHGSVAAVRGSLAGQPVSYTPPPDAVRQIDHFLESLSLETTDLGTIGPRLVRLCHALDHLTQLHEDLTRRPPAASGMQVPAGFQGGVQALDTWLAAATDQNAPDPTVFAALQDASQQLTAECRASRVQALEDIAQRRTSTATARALLDRLAWSDRALYHAWRLAESMRLASGQ